MMWWDYKNGKLRTVGTVIFVDQILEEKKKYILLKDGERIGELDKNNSFLRW